MTHSWDDSHFDVTNPDLGLLMSDCPAELSIQSHGLMLNVRRSVQLPRSREGTASPWTIQVPITREVAVLRRAKSFQHPAVSTSIGPSLSRIKFFFDFSRGDIRALEYSEVPNTLSQTGNFCATRGDGGVEEDDNQTINKIESALEEALNVGSLKIDVRERIKRIQTAFEGFIPWDSGTGKPKGVLSDVKVVDAVESEKPWTAGVVKLTTSQSDAGSELEPGSTIKGGLQDFKIGDEGQACNLGFLCTDNDSPVELNQEQIIQNINEGGLHNLNKVVEAQGDAAVGNPTPHNDGAIYELEEVRVIEDMEDGGLGILKGVKEVALSTEVVNPALTESDAFGKEEKLCMEMEETELSALDEVDEVQAVVLNFEAINPTVAVSDAFSELKRVRVNNDTIEERLWNSVSALPLDAQIAASSELEQESVVKEMNVKEPNVIVDEVQAEAGGESDPTEKDTTDISGLPSPLSQLLDYRNGSAYTFLIVQDHFADVGDCLLHDVEKVCNIQQETSLKSLLAPGESRCSQEEQTPQSSGGKISTSGRPKVIINLRRLRIRKSVRPNASKASPTKRLVVKSHTNLSEKYRPTRFKELVGQATVVKSLTTCISKQKVAPLYLFLGPRGTGKMSAARIFAAGLNCLSLEPKIRPCGSCRECRAVTLDMSPYVQIVDAATVHDSSSMKTVVNHTVGHNKVIIIKECDSVSTEIWTALLKVMEEPPSNVVLILISTAANRIPLTAISRCKKLHFYNVSDGEIVGRLQALAHQEDLEVEEGALPLIASRSNGSIHDAEIILDQLSFVDKKVSLASVQKHVGLLTDRKLLNLLDFALSADTANTTKTMNEILGSSVEPLLLVSQLGILITNVLVGNFDVHRETRESGYFRPSFSSEQMQRRLRQALKILSEAEKYVRVSTDSLTWLTAALLQCASDRPFPPSVVESFAHTLMTPKSLEMLVSTDVGTAENEFHPTQGSELAAEETHEGHGVQIASKLSEPSASIVETSVEKSPGVSERELKESQEAEEHKQAPDRLNAQETLVAENIHVLEERDFVELWNRVLQELTSRNLKHLLLTQGRLVSAGVASDGSRAIVEVEIQYAIDKHKAERSWRSICSAFQSVLSSPIELRISLMKNVLDEGLLPCNLEDMDDEERGLLTQHVSRLKQEAEVASYSTEGSHSKRRRRRARRVWQPTEMLEQELELRHNRPESSSFSESVEQNSGSIETVQSNLLVGVKAPRPLLRTMLDTPLSDSDEKQATQSNSPKELPAEFRTYLGLPLEGLECTQRVRQFRREPTRGIDKFEGRRERDVMDGRGRAQGQAFFLRLVPCKSISTVRFSEASFSDIRC